MQRPVHPIHAVLLGGTVALFLGVLLTDITYYRTFEVQWKNFASWLLVGALVFCGLTMLCALIGNIGLRWRARSRVIYLLILLAVFVLGLIDAFVHAADAWASMPQGLVLSVIVFALVLASTWFAFADPGPDAWRRSDQAVITTSANGTREAA